MSIWKPTQAQCDLIRKAAVLESSPRATLGQIKLVPCVRYNTQIPDRASDINIALVSGLEGGSWNDTDLADKGCWNFFRKGVDLPESGEAIIDFAIYARTQTIADKLEYLLGNIIAFYKDGDLTALRGVGAHGHDYLPKLKAERGSDA